jgi:hypothetical protein
MRREVRGQRGWETLYPGGTVFLVSLKENTFSYESAIFWAPCIKWYRFSIKRCSNSINYFSSLCEECIEFVCWSWFFELYFYDLPYDSLCLTDEFSIFFLSFFGAELIVAARSRDLYYNMSLITIIVQCWEMALWFLSSWHDHRE